MLSRVKGTRDILDASGYKFLEDAIRDVFVSACFSEIKIPTIEFTDLFKRSLGESTEVVSKEMFLVNSMHGTENTMCLRPEGTASIMRAFLMEKPAVMPWNVLTSGSFFRYERPQKGRYREFYSTSIEMIGAQSYVNDVQLLLLLNKLFKRLFGKDAYTLYINFLGSIEDRIRYKKVLKDFIFSHTNIPEKIVFLADKNILRTFDLKDPDCQEFMKDAPDIIEYLSDASRERWNKITRMLDEVDIEYKKSHKLVRGLDYYNDIVFEFVSEDYLGAQSTFCGGGRYDGLAQILGSKKEVPSIGAGLGLDRMLLMLEQVDKERSFEKNLYIAAYAHGVEYQKNMLSIVSILREAGKNVCFYTDVSSLKNALKKANAEKAPYIIIIGEDEAQNNSVAIKNMSTGEQVLIKNEDIKSYFASICLR